MPWIVPAAIAAVAVVTAVAVTSNRVNEKERKAADGYKQNKDEVERKVRKHKKKIEKKVRKQRRLIAKRCEREESRYRFDEMRAQYYASVKAVDTAYRALMDARTSIDTTGKMIVAAKEQIRLLVLRMNEAKAANDRPVFDATTKELEAVRQHRRALFDEQGKMMRERQALQEEVLALSRRTRKWKLRIRDECGRGGKVWFDRLEQRTARRRLGYLG